MSTVDSSRKLYIHGFLEKPSRQGLKDFSVLNLYELAKYSDQEIIKKLSSLSTIYNEVVAYSLGGRFLMRFYQNLFIKFKKISILSSNPGKFSLVDRNNAKAFHHEVNFKLKKLKHDDFLTWWNQLPLFQGDQEMAFVDETYDYFSLFNRWPSYCQSDYSDLLTQNNIKHLVYGEFDGKYKKIYKNLGLEDKTIEISGIGHRTNTDKIINRITEGYYD